MNEVIETTTVVEIEESLVDYLLAYPDLPMVDLGEENHDLIFFDLVRTRFEIAEMLYFKGIRGRISQASEEKLKEELGRCPKCRAWDLAIIFQSPYCFGCDDPELVTEKESRYVEPKNIQLKIDPVNGTVQSWMCRGK